jgi:hypothetical protein
MVVSNCEVIFAKLNIFLLIARVTEQNISDGWPSITIKKHYG